MSHANEPARKRRRTNDNDEAIPPHTENRSMGASKKPKKDSDGDTLMSQPQQPTDVDEKTTDPKQQNVDSPFLSQQTAPGNDVLLAPLTHNNNLLNTPPSLAPAPPRPRPHPRPSSFDVPRTDQFNDMFGGGTGHDEDFIVYSSGPNLKTENNNFDALSMAGDNGLNASQMKPSELSTEEMFRKTKDLCEMAWKMHGSLEARHKRDMSNQERDFANRISSLNEAHEDALDVQKKEHLQAMKEAAAEARAALADQKMSYEKQMLETKKRLEETEEKLSARDKEISGLRDDKQQLEAELVELKTQYHALMTRFEGVKNLMFGGTGELPSTPASSDGNPSKGPKSKKRRLSEI